MGNNGRAFGQQRDVACGPCLTSPETRDCVVVMPRIPDDNSPADLGNEARQKRCVKPFIDYAALMLCARVVEVEYVVSNDQVGTRAADAEMCIRDSASTAGPVNC